MTAADRCNAARLGVTPPHRSIANADRRPPIPPFGGCVAHVRVYIIGFINSFGGNFIGLVGKTQVTFPSLKIWYVFSFGIRVSWTESLEFW